jgi:hypothetical protein
MVIHQMHECIHSTPPWMTIHEEYASLNHAMENLVGKKPLAKEKEYNILMCLRML